MKELKENDTRHSQITQLILDMMINECHTFSLVEEDSFKILINFLAPNYKMPTRNTFAINLLDNMHTRLENSLIQKCKEIEYFTLIVDGWTCKPTRDSFFGIVITGINKNFERFYYVLSLAELNDGHKANTLFQIINEVLSKYQLEDKILSIVSDNENTMKCLANLYANKIWIGCCAHKNQLIINNFVLKQELISQTVEKFIKIKTHFYHSYKDYKKLKIHAQEINIKFFKIKDDVDSRWDRTFYLLESIYKIKAILLSYYSEKEFEKKYDIYKLDWIKLETIIEILRPFEEANKMFQSKSNFLSLILSFIKTTVNYNQNVFSFNLSEDGN